MTNIRTPIGFSPRRLAALPASVSCRRMPRPRPGGQREELVLT